MFSPSPRRSLRLQTLTRVVITLGCVAMLVPAGLGAVIRTPLGNAPPPAAVGGITMIAAPLDEPDGVYRPPLGADVTHAPSVRGSVVFNTPHNHRRIGQGWTQWGHGYAGDVYVVPGIGTQTQLTLPAGTRAFILYVSPATATPYSVSISANGAGAFEQEGVGAIGIAFHRTGDSTINTIQVASSAPVAVGEFYASIPSAELHVSTGEIASPGCFEFDLAQFAGHAGDITQIVAQVLSPGAQVVQASGSCGGATVTPTSVTWNFPEGLSASYPNLDTYCRAGICLTSPTPAVTLLFTGAGPGGEPLTSTQTVVDQRMVAGLKHPVGCDRFFTLDAHFDQGTYLSVDHNSPNNQLQITNPAKPLPYLAVACSGRPFPPGPPPPPPVREGTIVRIDVNTGTVLGEYKTAPAGFRSNPSRTTVDLYGNVWVTNRDEGVNPIGPGSVTKIGICIGQRYDRSGTPGNYIFTPNTNGQYIVNPSYNTCWDRDGDGAIKTSRGLGDILAWNNVTDGDGGGIVANVAQGGPALVEDAEDEMILVYQRTHSRGNRHLSIDTNNDVWVGGHPTNVFDHMDGNDGSIFTGNLASVPSPSCGGYGGFLDCQGVLWSATQSAGQTWRFVPPAGAQLCIPIPGSYGLAIDTSNTIWNTSYTTDRIYRINPAGTPIGAPLSTDANSTVTSVPTGVAVSPATDHVWIANRAGNTVCHLNNAGAQVGGLIPVGISPSGMFVDSNAQVWTTNIGSDNAMRINPGSHAIGPTVPLGGGSGPYNYSDGTGIIGLNSTSGQGAWIVIQDSQNLQQCWGKITWNTEPQGFVPAGGAILVEARAADNVPGLGGQTFVPVVSGTPFSIVGRFIEVRVTLKPGQGPAGPCDWITPVLSDIRIRCCTCEDCHPPSPNIQPDIDQRCGNLSDGTAHYSIDAIGLISNPCGFISVGERKLPNGLPGVHVVHWSRNGAIIRERLFSTTVANESIVGTSVDVNSDCDILIAGRTQSPSGLATFAARLDQNLAPIWSTRLPGNNSGGESVQADWLNDGLSVAVSGMAGTGGTPARGRLTKLDAITGSCIWWKEYSSTFSASDRFIIEDLEQAPGVNGNIWVCGGLQYTQAGNPTARVPMLMEVANAGAAAGIPVGVGVRIYPFPAGSAWTTSRYNAIKFNPTLASPFQNDIVVAGWATRPLQPFGFALSGRVGIINSTAGALQHWDYLYNGFSVLPGTSAISIPPQSIVSPNLIVVAGRDQDGWFGRTLRVSESTGAFISAQSHGFPNIPNQTYKFADITPGGVRTMIGHYSDLQPFPNGGARLYWSLGTCPAPGAATLENMVVPQNLQPGEISVANAQPCAEMTLVEIEVQSPCDDLCRESLLGDMNCNGVVSVGDIAGFVLALTDPSAYTAQYPECDINNADMNQNGAVSVADIGLFVAALIEG